MSVQHPRPHFRLVLRPEPGVGDPTRALRRLLKFALRRCGLRCVAVAETTEATRTT
jgi:hypothetical protein